MKRFFLTMSYIILLALGVYSTCYSSIVVDVMGRKVSASAFDGIVYSSSDEYSLEAGEWHEYVEAIVSDDTYASSQQDSFIDDGANFVIEAYGESFANAAEQDDTNCMNYVQVFFYVLDEPFEYILDYDVSGGGEGDSTVVILRNAGYIPGIDILVARNTSEVLSGVLNPGYYSLWAAANAYDGGYGHVDNTHCVFDVYFGASTVPIPSAVWLLGSGLIGVVGIRRKIKK